MSEKPKPTSGLIIVDKPAGMTSHDVVARMRRIVGTRKIGHAGTLDPMATGILVLGVERATKLLGYVMGHDKTYVATVCLGASTTTDDREGDILERTDASTCTEADIHAAFAAQVGDIEQTPSAVSAIKVNGRRAYDLVREGAAPELTARPVTVHSIEIRSVEIGAQTLVEIEVRCSAGTYIRAIARDVGSALGMGGHLTALRRTASGEFDESVALTPEAIAELPDPVALTLDEAVRRTFPVRVLTDEQVRELSYGRRIGPASAAAQSPGANAEETIGAVDHLGKAIALLDANGKPKVVFAPA